MCYHVTSSDIRKSYEMMSAVTFIISFITPAQRDYPVIISMVDVTR
jgi:hypothetical protein